MNRIKIPDNWLGEPIDGAIERVLEAKDEPEPPQQPEPTRPDVTNIAGNDRYIFLEGRQHGNYEYPGLLVAMDRTHKGKNWNDTWSALRQEDALMLTPRQYVDFLNLLKSGKAYDGNGRTISSSKLPELFDDITKVQSPWRSEWLDAKFENKVVGKKLGGLMNQNSLHIVYHKLDNGNLIEVADPLDGCLAEDRKPGIDMNYWLSNATEQGLPPKDNQDGQLWYWHPRDGRVAGFDAGSDGAYLSCGRYPADSDPSLGVRAVRRHAQKI